MPTPRTVFIVNPHAGNGSTGRNWPEIERLSKAHLGDFSTNFTQGPLEAETFAARAVADGSRLVVCIGGDGTFNEVVNGVMAGAKHGPSDISIGFIPDGTGCDFVKTAAIPKNIPAAVDIIAADHGYVMDLGRLSYCDHNGQKKHRYFHNIASFGVAGEVDERVNQTPQTFGPFVSFLWATLAAILRYGTKTVTLQIDDGPARELKIWNVAVANGRFQGAGMLVAPDASISDGRFNVTLIGDLSLRQVFLNLHNLYNGNIYAVPKVEHCTAKTVTVTSDERVLLDVDGEQPGILPAQFDIVPGAIRLLAPPA